MFDQCFLCCKLLQAVTLCCKQHISDCCDKLAGAIRDAQQYLHLLACFGYADDRHLD